MGLIFCNVKTTYSFYALFLLCSKRWFIQRKLCTLIFSLNKTTYGIVKKRRIETMRRFYIAENQAQCNLGYLIFRVFSVFFES